MAVSVKQLVKRPERLAPGHRACAGCVAPSLVRMALKATEDPVVCSIATGCLEVSTTIYPYNAWRVSMIHSAFENAASTIAGVEAAYQKLRRDGRIKERFRFIAFAGDGGTYDIGIQALSGAIERGHDFLFICYDNQAYMNTGIQRSSATPLGAATSTSPAGRVIPGKQQHRKDLTAIIIAHDIPYAAQAAVHNMRDFIRKVERGLEVEGPAFINVLAPCFRGWRHPAENVLEVSKLASETCFWPLYEVDGGKWKLNYKPKEKLPVTDWLKGQGRFRHVLKPGNEHLVESLQKHVDGKWDELLRRTGKE